MITQVTYRFALAQVKCTRLCLAFAIVATMLLPASSALI